MTSARPMCFMAGRWLGAALLLTCSLWASTGHAAPGLLGTQVTVSLTNTGIGLDASDVVTVDAGVEFTPGNGTNIGANLLTGVGQEAIDIGAYTIFLRVKGDDYLNFDGTGPYTAGFDATAAFVFSGLDIAGETITGFTVADSGVENFDINWFSLDNANQLTFVIGLAEFTPTTPDTFGEFTITLTTRDNGTPPGPTPMPEPGSLALAGLALAALGWAHRRQVRARR